MENSSRKRFRSKIEVLRFVLFLFYFFFYLYFLFFVLFLQGETSTDSKEACYKCRICNKKFNRAERLSSHMATHRGYDCTEQGCGKVNSFVYLLN